MLNSKRKIKVLLYGNFHSGIHRSQTLVKFLLSSEYHVSLACPDLYVTRESKKDYLLDKVFVLFQLLELFTKAIFIDVIYLLPDNNRFIKNATWAAKLFNKKLVVEIYISLYDTFVKDRKIIEDGSRQAKALIAKDRLALTKSDYIIHTAGHELSYWEKTLGININQNKVFISPLCSVSSLAVRRSFMQDDVLKICWWGTFIPLHGLDNILQAVKILKEQKIQFTCNLFGIDNSFFPIYTEKIQLDELDQHVLLRKDLSFSNGSLPEYLVDNCDLALGIFGDTDKAHNTIPNKLVEALSMGIPTLTMDSPALQEFFEGTDLWACNPSPEAIAESILEIASGTAHPVNWEQTRQKVLATFSVAQYQDVVTKVLGKVKEDLLVGGTLGVEKAVFVTHQPALNQVDR